MQRIGFNGPAAPPGLFAGNERAAQPGKRVDHEAMDVRVHFDAPPRQFYGNLRFTVLPAQGGDLPHARVAPLAPFLARQPLYELKRVRRERRYPRIFLIVVRLGRAAGISGHIVELRRGLV